MAVAVMMLTGNLTFKRLLGDDGISAYSIACYLFPLVYMVYSAVAQSSQPIISFNYGANLRQRVRKTMLIRLSVSIFLGFCISATFVFFAPTVVSIC